MPKYMLILRGDATADYSQFTPDDFARILGEYEAWGNKLAAEGRLQLGQKLTDQGGKVIWPRGKGKKNEVKDGPYVESKEVVGGVYIVKADSYDHAVKLCDGHPNFAFGSIEVRELDFLGGPET
ncbi:MAG: YciI family protein [Planctomycetota bacterium]